MGIPLPPQPDLDLYFYFCVSASWSWLEEGGEMKISLVFPGRQVPLKLIFSKTRPRGPWSFDLTQKARRGE